MKPATGAPKDDFKISGQEADRLKACFKDPKFMKMFEDYAKEISDPENFLRNQEEIRKLEEQNRNDPEIWKQELADIQTDTTKQQQVKSKTKAMPRKPVKQAKPAPKPKKAAPVPAPKPAPAPSAPAKPIIKEVGSRPAPSNIETPKYQIAYNNDFDWGNHFNVQTKPMSTRPTSLTMSVTMPAEPPAETLDIDVEQQWVVVKAAGYELEAPLTFPVVAESVSAQYSDGVLVLTMPIAP